MKKKFTSMVLAGILAVGACAVPAFAEAEESRFTVVSVPCEEGERYFMESWQLYDGLTARYSDDKTPIPLSEYYDGRMFATIPAEYAQRGIEWYVAEEKEFADDNGSYEFYSMEKLSACGVISGDENGNALPYGNISRAEATAMIMRFLGLEASSGTDSGFDDVPEDAWYAPAVTAARKAGLISGVSDNEFCPNREVSREEITAMTARAVWYAGLQNENADATLADLENLALDDAEEISPWAYSAYKTMKSFNITDYEYFYDGAEEPIDINYAHPKTAATRTETAELLYSVIGNFQSYPSQIAESFGFDKEMPVIDGSTSTYPFTEAIYSTLFSLTDTITKTSRQSTAKAMLPTNG